MNKMGMIKLYMAPSYLNDFRQTLQMLMEKVLAVLIFGR